MQKSHPLGYLENRSALAKRYWNCNDFQHRKKLFKPKLDNLDGGIGYYFSKIKLENQKKMDQNYLKRYLNNKKEQKMTKYKYQNLNSKRVIYPEKNTEFNKTTKKRTFKNSKSNLFNVTDGRISSLFLRTPWTTTGKGKKILNYSVDYGRKRDTDIFSDAFLNDKKYNRIPGVLRKGNVPRIEQFLSPISNTNKGKKHFH